MHWMSALADHTHLVLAAGKGGGDTLENPAPQAPPGMKGTFTDWIAWGKYVGMAAGAGGLISCGIMMALGRRNRSHLAAEGASGIVWVIAGISAVSLSVSVVTAMMG